MVNKNLDTKKLKFLLKEIREASHSDIFRHLNAFSCPSNKSRSLYYFVRMGKSEFEKFSVSIKQKIAEIDSLMEKILNLPLEKIYYIELDRELRGLLSEISFARYIKKELKIWWNQIEEKRETQERR